MKKLILLLSVITILSSCGNEPPRFNDISNPFIIGEIKQNKDLVSSTYYKNTITKSAVVLPTGMYNIGDTILIK